MAARGADQGRLRGCSIDLLVNLLEFCSCRRAVRVKVRGWNGLLFETTNGVKYCLQLCSDTSVVFGRLAASDELVVDTVYFVVEFSAKLA